MWLPLAILWALALKKKKTLKKWKRENGSYKATKKPQNKTKQKNKPRVFTLEISMVNC
jgi:hypothetical protein